MVVLPPAARCCLSAVPRWQSAHASAEFRKQCDLSSGRYDRPAWSASTDTGYPRSGCGDIGVFPKNGHGAEPRGRLSDTIAHPCASVNSVNEEESRGRPSTATADDACPPLSYGTNQNRRQRRWRFRPTL